MLTYEDRNEIIWRIRKETGVGLATIDKALDRFIEALKRKPHMMDAAYDLNFEWKARDMRRQLHFKDCCKSCVYNLYGMPPCQKMNEPQVIEFLEKDIEENECCPEWYAEC